MNAHLITNLRMLSAEPLILLLGRCHPAAPLEAFRPKMVTSGFGTPIVCAEDEVGDVAVVKGVRTASDQVEHEGKPLTLETATGRLPLHRPRCARLALPVLAMKQREGSEAHENA
tara:strand:- start:21082 stop:21426 length:345 start_codon:yes stop_codon:yes gene_type:complete